MKRRKVQNVEIWEFSFSLQFDTIVYNLQKKPESQRGYVLSARTAARFPPLNKVLCINSTCHWQWVQPTLLIKTKKMSQYKVRQILLIKITCYNPCSLKCCVKPRTSTNILHSRPKISSQIYLFIFIKDVK